MNLKKSDKLIHIVTTLPDERAVKALAGLLEKMVKNPMLPPNPDIGDVKDVLYRMTTFNGKVAIHTNHFWVASAVLGFCQGARTTIVAMLADIDRHSDEHKKTKKGKKQ